MNKKNETKNLRVVELFAGVGGFRIGLEGYGKRKVQGYKTVWSNQWEPSTKVQHASELYVRRFGKEGHSNQDIAQVKIEAIPDHDLLVGGFPCQDYSVARVLSQAKGILGKKGVLWWEIHRIIKEKGAKAPNFLFLENVDRLLKSPANQRGRDFAVMLKSLSDLGYIVEWRVINAADYGFPQRRKRTYILGYKKGSFVYRMIRKNELFDWIIKSGVFAKAFPVLNQSISFDEFTLEADLTDISRNFNNKKGSPSPFGNVGIMKDGKVLTAKVKPNYKGKSILLGDIIEDEVDETYFIDKNDLKDWIKLKGAKKETRQSRDGFKYNYSEGAMLFPDSLDKPSRTIVTGEGGSAPSRFKHVIKTKSGRLRRLTPTELEKLNMFPVNHTEGVSDVRRAFLMGNALVVGVVEKVGRELIRKIRENSQ